MVDEAALLDKLRKDKCDIYRNTEVEAHDITSFKRQLIHQGIRCRLSTTNPVISATDTTARTANAYTVFFHPSVDIQAGDKLVITTAIGYSYELYAGKPNGFAGSHIEVMATEEEYV